MKRNRVRGLWICFLLAGLLVLTALPAGARGEEVPDAVAPAPPEVELIPAPQELSWLEDDFVVRPDTRIVVGDEAESKDLYAAREINEELETRFGFSLEVVRASEAGDPYMLQNAIVLGEPAINKTARELLDLWGMEVSHENPGPEGYVLEVMPEYVIVSGSDRRGTFYGAQTLRQLFVPDVNAGASEDYVPAIVKGASIRDWPGHEFRGVLFHPDDYSRIYHAEMIDKVFSKYKFNNIIIEAEYVKWDSQPGLHMPWAASKDDIRHLIQVAEEHLIDVNPLIQTLGHCEWLFKNGQNRDLLENPERLYAYNPLNPRTYEVIFGILDEAIELFDPEFVHIGHDEIDMFGRYQFPTRPEGQKLGFSELFVRDVNKLYDYITAQGPGVMMWGDELLKERMKDYLDRIPKDIIVCDWHYSPAERYPSIKYLQDAGYSVIGSTWDNPRNIRTFSREIAYAGETGMLQTTWAGYSGTRTQFTREFDQVTAYILAGEHFWNPLGERSKGPVPYDVERLLMRDWGPQRYTIDSKAGVLIDLTDVANRNLIDRPGEPGWLARGGMFDLREFPTGRQRVDGVLVQVIDPEENGGNSVVMLGAPEKGLEQLPEKVTGIEVDSKARYLHFLQATGSKTTGGALVGQYTVHYADGTKTTIPLSYGENISSWIGAATQAVIGGKTTGGLKYSIGLYKWDNPHPEKEIATIDFESYGTRANPILFAITAVKEE